MPQGRYTDMELNTLKDLYILELKDLYSAETQIIKALPKLAKAATNKQLAAAFNAHLAQTRRQAERLEKLLKRHGESTRGPKCQGMEGVLKEGDEMLEEDALPEVRDAGLIAAAQRVEHYEMAGYGCARTYATELGDTQGAKTLATTLLEEEKADEKLSKIARSVVNLRAKSRRLRNPSTRSRRSARRSRKRLRRSPARVPAALAQRRRHFPQHAVPIAVRALAKEAHRRIPRRPFGVGAPTPVARAGEQRPDRPAHRACQMGRRRVHADDQVQFADERRRVGKAAELRAQVTKAIPAGGVVGWPGRGVGG